MLNNIQQFAIPITNTLLLFGFILFLIHFFFKYLNNKTVIIAAILSFTFVYSHWSGKFSEKELNFLDQSYFISTQGNWIDCNFAQNTTYSQDKTKMECLGTDRPSNPPGIVHFLTITKSLSALQNWKLLSLFILWFMLFSILSIYIIEITNEPWTLIIVLLIVFTKTHHLSNIEPDLLSSIIISLLCFTSLKLKNNLYPSIILSALSVYVEPTNIFIPVILFGTNNEIKLSSRVAFLLSVVILCVPLFFWASSSLYYSKLLHLDSTTVTSSKVMIYIFGLAGFIIFKNMRLTLCLIFALFQSLLLKEDLLPVVISVIGISHLVQFMRSHINYHQYWHYLINGLLAFTLIVPQAGSSSEANSINIPEFGIGTLVFSNTPSMFHIQEVSSIRLESLLDEASYIEKLKIKYGNIIVHLPQKCDPSSRLDLQSNIYNLCKKILGMYELSVSPQGHPFYSLDKRKDADKLNDLQEK